MSDNFWEAYLRSESSKFDGVAVNNIYIDINDGALYDGVLFSQIMYWHGYDKKGKCRLQVFHDGHFWLAKKDADWFGECRIKARTARECIGRMVKRGLLIKVTYKFNGIPMTHIRVNREVFEERVRAISTHSAEELTSDVNSTCHEVSNPSDKICQVHSPSDVKSLTESTSQITSENKTKWGENADKNGSCCMTKGTASTADAAMAVPPGHISDLKKSDNSRQNGIDPAKPSSYLPKQTALEQYIAELTNCRNGRLNKDAIDKLNEPMVWKENEAAGPLPSANELYDNDEDFRAWIREEVTQRYQKKWAPEWQKEGDTNAFQHASRIARNIRVKYDWYNNWADRKRSPTIKRTSPKHDGNIHTVRKLLQRGLLSRDEVPKLFHAQFISEGLLPPES